MSQEIFPSPHCSLLPSGDAPSLALELNKNSDPASQVPADFLLLQSLTPDSIFGPPVSGTCPSYPLFYPMPTAAVSPVPAPAPAALPTAKRRSRKKRADSESNLTPAELRALHAEKNRQFARESRERKQLYVERLEREVESLRTELSQCKERLARYELIDSKRQMDKPSAVLKALDEMQRTHAGRERFKEILIRKFDEQFEDRKKAVEQLFRILLEITMPLPLRFHMWEADNDVDAFNPENFSLVLGYQPTKEQLQRIQEHIKIAHAGHEAYHREMKAKFAKVAPRIRANVKKMLEYHREIQIDTYRIMVSSMKARLLSSYTVESAEEDMRYVPNLYGRPELSDEALLQINEHDFWLDTHGTEAADADIDEEDCRDKGHCVGSSSSNNNQSKDAGVRSGE